ncbi:MAG: hypothetical protein JO056_10035 [Alphaproteobacteria bacterium]|nr:hypothetical protein [Alphaproteobacteria bacterium]
MFHDVAVLLFAITAGLTASGITANGYRLAESALKAKPSSTVYHISMVVAGPSVLLENAAKAWKEKSCSWIAFWLAAAVAAYWSLAIGLLIVEVALAV